LNLLETQLKHSKSSSNNMAATKRKAEEKPAKKAQSSGNDRAAKRPRKEDDPAKTPREKPAAKEASTQKLLPKVSILQQEEKAFPRGGGSVLTPLEHKQIQIQATRDVLFEESGQKRPAKDGLEDGSDFECHSGEEEKKLKKKSKKTRSAKVATGEQAEKRLRVDGLKFKRLAPGVLILSQITHISAQELVVDLPNNLTGIVPITNISAQFTKKLEALANAVDKEKEDENDEDDADDDDVNLKDYFQIGQYLRTSVVSTSEESQGKDASKARKRIELTLEPQVTNKGISSSDVCPNCMLQASVKSVEDHGLIMALGLQESSVSGFVPKKELPDGFNISKVREGAVMLCSVIKLEQNGKVVKLSARLSKAGDASKVMTLQKAPTINSILPGAAVEVLISQTSYTSLAGKVMGMVDVAADIVHSGAGPRNTDIEAKYKIGEKVKARIIFMVTDGDSNVFGVSVLDHILTLSEHQSAMGKKPLEVLPLSATIEQAKIVNVESGLGLYVDVDVKGVPGFVHISRVADTKIDTLSKETGTYKSGTTHKARLVGYNAIDGLYLLSLEKSVIESPFLRIEDLPIGGLVKGKVERIVVNARGVGGIIVNLAPSISGLVPEMHLSDIHLQHPEKKFKVGINVPARVLSTDSDKHQVRLTLKKTLVNSDAAIWTSFNSIKSGDSSLGTIIKITPKGAIVQFYGNVIAFLPVSEMSDAFIADPAQHFRIGQVVNVHAKSVDAAAARMTVSCRLQTGADAAQDAAFEKVQVGDLVSGKVVAQSAEDITIDLQSGLRGILPIGHLTDGDDEKNKSAAKRIKDGKQLQDLLVLDVHDKRRSVALTAKPSLVKAVKAGNLVKSFGDVATDKSVNGFVRHITPDAVFVQFAGGVTGLLHKTQLTDELNKLPSFGLKRDASITAKVVKVDTASQRFFLSMKETTEATPTPTKASATPGSMSNPVDGKATTLDDFAIGKTTRAKVTSIKNSQLNVRLADGVQGRIDVSEAFAKFEDITDRKNPLKAFTAGDVLPVKVLGMHDARSHRFLPISHRGGKVPLFELSTKLATGDSIVSLDQVKLDTWYSGFVNNINDLCIWVNLSPNVRGRIDRMHLSEDISLLNDLENSFPIGSAIRVRTTNIDVAKQRLDLSAIEAAAALNFEDVTPGMIATGRVTKVTEHSVSVQLSDSVSGQVGLTELSDDFNEADPTSYNKNDVVRVCVLDVDKSNKRISLSTRPSKVLSSALSVKDKSLSSIDQLKSGDVVRGFVKNVAEVGVFVTLSYNLTAFVRVSELSDAYVKDWKADFEVDKLVTGKILNIDDKTVKMSLKPSVVSDDYVPLLSFIDLEVGEVVTGKIRKVEDFGVFIVVDNSHNVSGLCHKSEIAEQRVEDVKKLYSEGDAVKAMVLKVEPDKRRVSFGLKASYFEDGDDDEDDDDEGLHDADSDAGVDLDDEDAMSVDGGAQLDEDIELADDDDDDAESEDDDDDDDAAAEDESDEGDEMVDAPAAASTGALDVGGFDFSGTAALDAMSTPNDLNADSTTATKKKKKSKPAITTDLTDTLDFHGPRSSSDFERLLLSSPHDSSLWIQYMAFQLNLSEIEAARTIAERALKRINIREQEEKMNVWIALLNLENAYGTDDSLEDVYKRACEVQDPKDIGERLASIYIQSGKMSVSHTTYLT